MSEIAPFIAVLESAQKKESNTTPEVQQAAEGIDIEAFKAAYEKVAEQGEFESVEGADKDVLNKAFEFAAKAVMLLKTSPGLLEKKDLYIYYKVSKAEVMEKPGMFDIQKKQLFGAWEKVKDYNPSKANQLYIAHVNTLIAKYGTRE
ncbi:uncharacterized protein N7511_007799 [Penicillium nucicola]|uniref:uncharacterized protein n=1 Tax=Penicillium nucicola TaxID=1850975 RepID=UPI0025457C63|nr:uncharacterized protein N7511_007799 [Penicillium nucicola]KAJ5753646.1 hypothetical protein N7511_007799 [Penicillium nucicola]